MKTSGSSSPGGRPRRNPKAAASSTFSVRFTPEERGWIDEAAALGEVAPASFVREAAVDRAHDVLNANGAEGELREMAELLASQVPSSVHKGILIDMLETATVPFVKTLVGILWELHDKERGYTPLKERRSDKKSTGAR